MQRQSPSRMPATRNGANMAPARSRRCTVSYSYVIGPCAEGRVLLQELSKQGVPVILSADTFLSPYVDPTNVSLWNNKDVPAMT